jgi:triphosphatase
MVASWPERGRACSLVTGAAVGRGLERPPATFVANLGAASALTEDYGQDSMETELKFALSPEARERIERHAEALAAADGRSAQTQHTTYFDTPGRALRKAGFTLRVREADDGFVQIVKSVGDGTLHRQECEWPVASAEPDRRLLAEVPGAPGLEGEPLEPVFRTDVRRTSLSVTPAAGSKIELAFDDGSVTAGDAGEPLSELELELKGGAEDALFRLGLDLLQVAPLALLNESKAERGWHLRDGGQPKARKPHPVVLEPGIAVHEAFARLAAGVLDDLLANQPAALRGEEMEGIHQMRVGIRRLGSLLVLFEGFVEPHAAARFEDELRRLGRVLGEARDWDVFLGELLPAAIETAADLKTVEPLRAAAEERRHAAHQVAKKAVQEPAFTRFVLAFRAWSGSAEATVPDRVGGQPLEELAPDMLDRLARKVEKRLADADPDEPTTLHELRKSAKKLRYAIEYFESLYGAKAERYYKRCSALQKRLGTFNDLVTLQRLTEELTAARLDLTPALGVVGNRSQPQLACAVERVDKPLVRMERATPFW